jgi:hypothetical protein
MEDLSGNTKFPFVQFVFVVNIRVVRSVYPRVQSFVTRIAMKMHNSFEKQERIHGDATRSELSLDTCRVWIVLCLSIASAICLRGKQEGRGYKL